MLFLTLTSACKGDKFQPQFVQSSIKINKVARDYWPTVDWQSKSPDELGGSNSAVEKAIDSIFADSIETDGIVIVKNGYIIGERYRLPYDQNSRHYSWSISKSVTDTLVGRAEQLGLVKRSDKLEKFFPNQKKEYSDITLDHLIRMESGLQWNETYEFNPLYSDVLPMLYGFASFDMGAYAGKKEFIYEPGEQLYYSSGTSNLLCKALKKIFKSSLEYSDFPWEQLFNPLGIKSAIWEQDGSETFVCSSYLHISARDLAKIGFLYLNNGQWDNSQLLPTTWVQTATSDTLSARETTETSAYGSSWYMNFDFSNSSRKREMQSISANTFWARGHWGQWLIILPDYDLVVVRFGNNRMTAFDPEPFLKALVQGIGNDN